MIALITVGITQGGRLDYLIDVPSLLITLGGTIGGLMAAYGTGFFRAIGTVFKCSADRETITEGVGIFRRARTYAIAAGVLGTTIGLVNMLGALDDPAALGPGTATALITTVYGFFLAYAIFHPVSASLERRLGESDE
jgi:flagellar motor component MotA